eukprot:TRINITY_DN25666_c0_g1_i1.p1 TRINITY_DN25666_c0_g1~~TRINITY_DN25666_c0_g1_i1.p1  ORF type:complete len:431 (+),score=75.67 TRINITY_DN25666_c0_g1_i1:91-1383(+)
MGCARSTEKRHAAPVCPTSDFSDRKVRVVNVLGVQIAIFRVRGKYYALDDACAHRGASLSLGDIEDCGGVPCVTCPWHGTVVQLTSGTRSQHTGAGCEQPLAGYQRQRVYHAFSSRGMVYVESVAQPGSPLAPGLHVESDRWVGCPRAECRLSPHSRDAGCSVALTAHRPASSGGAMRTFEFCFEPPSSAVPFLPGQYGVFQLPESCGLSHAGTPLLRQWTLHACGGGALAITVKRRAGGVASEWLHSSLSEGGTLRLVRVGGDFGVFCRRPPTPKLLMVAVGSGITPLYSQLLGLFGREPRPDASDLANLDVVLVYGERHRSDLAFANALDCWEADFKSPASTCGRSPASPPAAKRCLAVYYTLTQPEPTWGGLVGRVTVASLRSACPDIAERAVQLSGPRGWREAIVPQMVTECGVNPDWIAQEDFDL